MQIIYDTLNDGPKEAAGLAALLVILHGEGVLDAFDKIDQARPMLDAPALDGHPMPPETGNALDSAGTPWDERIHSSSRNTNKDGTWSRRRNTPDETFDAVMAELKGGKLPTGPEGKTEYVEGPDAAPQTAPPPPPPAAPVTPPDPPATITFPMLMIKVTKAQAAGKIDKPTVDGFLQSVGVASMAQLNGNPDKLAEVNALVDATIGE